MNLDSLLSVLSHEPVTVLGFLTVVLVRNLVSMNHRLMDRRVAPSRPCRRR